MLHRISLGFLAKELFCLVFSTLLVLTSFAGQAQAFSGVSPSSGSTLSTSVNGTTLTFTNNMGDTLRYDGTYVFLDHYMGRLIVTFSQDADISDITYRDMWGDGIRVDAYNSSGGLITTVSSSNPAFGDTNLSSNTSLAALTNVKRIEVYNYRGEWDPNFIQLKTITFTASATQDSDGDLTASATVTEPVALATTVDTVGEAVDIFDFTLSDGGASDGTTMDISEIVINVSGTSTDAQRGQVTWRLNGPDVSNVTGSYSAGLSFGWNE